MDSGAELKVAVVGLGGVGIVHLYAARSLPSLQLVGGVDPLPERRAIAETACVASFGDLDALLGSARPDLICVATPASLHGEAVIAAAAAGCHVLCEKPMTLSLASARGMIEACDRAAVRLFYGASYRHLPALVAARRLIAEGAIGTVLVVREALIGGEGAAARRPLGPLHYPAGGPGGGPMGLVDHGVHLLDALPWLIGDSVTSIYGRGNIAGQPPRPEFAILHFAGGAIGELLYEDGSFPAELPGEGTFSRGGGWAVGGMTPPGDWDPTPGTITVFGTAGSLRIAHYANQLYLRTVTGVREVPLTGAPPPGQFAAQLLAVRDDIVSGSHRAADGKDAFRALELLLAVYDSQREGRPIMVTGA